MKMENFRTITQRLLNHALFYNYNHQPDSTKKNNCTFKLTELHQHQIVDRWMMNVFQSFITSNYYPGIGQLKPNQEQYFQQNKRIWELLNVQGQIQNSFIVQSQTRNKIVQNQTKNKTKLNDNDKKTGTTAISIEAIQKKYLTGKVSQKIEQTKIIESFITRIYDQQLSEKSNLLHETNSTTYITDWSKGSDQKGSHKHGYPKVTIVNPSLSIYNKLVGLDAQNQRPIIQLPIDHGQQLLFTKPSSIILTSSSIISLLSTISLSHLLFYWSPSQQSSTLQLNQMINHSSLSRDQVERENYMRIGRRQIIKIITTKQIYDKYLQLFKFIRLVASFIDRQKQFIGSFKSYSDQSNILQLTQQLDDKFQAFDKENSESFENKVHYILSNYHFHIIKPQQRFSFNNLQLSFRDYNLFPYQNYDLEIYNSVNGNFLALLEQKNLKNVKQIYYTHKKGFITEDHYHSIIKRLQQKQTLIKNNQSQTLKYFPPVNNQTIVQLLKHQRISIIRKSVLLSQQKGVKFVKITSLLHQLNPNNSSTINSNKVSSNQSSNKQVYNDPYCISIDSKNLIFADIRRIQVLSLLSDTDIHHLVQQGVLLQLNQNQLIYNPTMKFQHFFVVLKGICQLQHKSLSSAHFIQQRNVFGWNHFIQTTHLNSFSDQNQLSQKQTKEEVLQKQSLFTVYSPKATLLRIELNSLKYLLFDKLPLLKKLSLFDLDKSVTKKQDKRDEIISIIHETLLVPEQNLNKALGVTPILCQQKQFAKILMSPTFLKRLKVFRQKCSQNNPHQINLIDSTSDNPLKVLLLNYPNLVLIF